VEVAEEVRKRELAKANNEIPKRMKKRLRVTIHIHTYRKRTCSYPQYQS